MKTLYLDCGMGAAGDMLAAALLELLPDKDAFIRELNALGIPDVTFKAEPSVKCGITGTHFAVLAGGMEEESTDVHGHDHHHSHEHPHDDGHHPDHDHTHEHEHEHDHDHHHGHEHDHGHGHEHTHSHFHGSLHEIEHIVRDHLPLSDKVKSDILAVYQLIADAESQVHGAPVSDIHFHEVGTMDAVADITAVCLLMDRIAPDEVLASPVHVGSGQVRAAHGILPVPAPATALILKDVPVYGGSIKGELCTPTGAALLKHFVTRFGDMPVIRPEKIGYGCGKKDFEAANCLRAVLGKTSPAVESVIELFCNIDDMTPESLSFAMEQLFAAGALEVYTIPVGMKKSRTGFLLSVMCKEEDRDRMTELVFRHTTTIGIRERTSRRYTLKRKIETLETPFGPVRRKVSEGFGVKRGKYEYEDLAEIARKEGLSLAEIRDRLG